MNKYKQFIKDAYNGDLGLTMCQEWKEKIDNKFPKLFKKEILEVGKWYKNNSDYNYLINYQGIKGNYGFFDGEWGQYWSYGSDKVLGSILATEEEVKEALIKEAEKRGYKDGVIVNSFVHDRILEIIDSKNNIEFIGYRNKLHYGTEQGLYVVIFDNGKWAEIIENIISRAEAEKQLNAKIID